MSKERVIVYVDGSNFFYYCKELSIPSHPHFDFEKFISFLVNDRTLISKNYYIGGVRAKPNDTKAMKMMQKQMSFFSYLKKHQWKISKGYLLKVDNRHHEKGVDVKLALDMVLNAVDNLCDTAILVSSDTDLLPAVVQTQERSKQVEYIGFSHQPSLAMVSKCRIRRLLTARDLRGFVVKE